MTSTRSTNNLSAQTGTAQIDSPVETSSLRVSVIATVYNEGESIRRLLESLLAQTRQPDEVVICDGGSQDNTVAILESYQGRLPLRVLVQAGANISEGRNAAIHAAAGPVIAATDAGVRLDPHWLARLMRPFEQASERFSPESSPPMAVAGFFLPDTDDLFTTGMFTTGMFTTAMAATVLPLADDIDPETFLPSSRSVAFTKAAWSQVGGYPEWLDYCEDLIFDIKIKEISAGADPAPHTGFVWVKDALAYFRPREDLPSFWRQYYRYARGDGKADLWRKRHGVRYAIYLVLLPALIGHGIWGFFARWLGWLGLLAGVIAYCARPWQRLMRIGRHLSTGQWLAAFALVPVIRGVGDLAKMAGYPVGRLWRWRNRKREEIWWREGSGPGTGD